MSEDIVVEHYLRAVSSLRESGTKLVDKSEWNYRLSICKKCEKYEQYDSKENETIFKCTQCGCLGFKFMVASSRCPLQQPKWR
tara:strand:+ start:26002 stop:26250 length:249 start_codon:yes stop_codon:yes gene_type:complete